jgi:hypothetical protein
MVDDMIELELADLRIKLKKKSKKKKKKEEEKEEQRHQSSRLEGYLVDYGVLKKLMPASMSDLIGEPNLLRTKE